MIGYAARTRPQFRYEGDNREVHLEMSATALALIARGVALLNELSGDELRAVTPLTAAEADVMPSLLITLDDLVGERPWIRVEP